MNGGATGRTLPPGGSAFVLMDVDAGAASAAARRADGSGCRSRARCPERTAVGRSRCRPGRRSRRADTFLGAPTRVDPSARGRGRAAAARRRLAGLQRLLRRARRSHRGAILAINGAPHVSERFAIDFVRLDDERKLFPGPVDQLASYAYFGVPVYSVAAGRW